MVTDDPGLARGTRRRLWAEHLDRREDELPEDPLEAIERLWKPISQEQAERREQDLPSPPAGPAPAPLAAGGGARRPPERASRRRVAQYARRRQDDLALDALGFDAIRTRLAAETAFAGGQALAASLLPSPDPVVVAGRVAETEEALYLAEHEPPELTGARDVRAAADRAARGGVLDPRRSRRSPRPPGWRRRCDAGSRTIPRSQLPAGRVATIEPGSRRWPSASSGRSSPTGRTCATTPRRRSGNCGGTWPPSGSEPPTGWRPWPPPPPSRSTCRRPSSPSAAAGPSWPSRPPTAPMSRGSSTTPPGRGRPSSSSRSRSSSSPTACAS